MLPEKGSTNSLVAAERELDAATDARLSKIAASVKSIKEVLDEVDGREVNAALWALEVTESLTGAPRHEDFLQADERMAKFLGSDAKAAYDAAMKDVSVLNAQIKAAEQAYETEKAKKNAEYAAKLAQINAEAKIAIDTLAAERSERRSDWLFIGGTIIALAGVGVMFATPAKKLGAVLIAVGGVAFSIPYIVSEPWFKLAVGIVLGLLALGLAMYIYSLRFKNECPQETPKKDEPTV